MTKKIEFEKVETLKKQILAVRDTGKTNMFDLNVVQQIANEMEFYDLVIFIEENHEAYCRFILEGEDIALSTQK